MKVQLNVGQTQSLLLYDSLLLSVATAFEKKKKKGNVIGGVMMSKDHQCRNTGSAPAC